MVASTELPFARTATSTTSTTGVPPDGGEQKAAPVVTVPHDQSCQESRVPSPEVSRPTARSTSAPSQAASAKLTVAPVAVQSPPVLTASLVFHSTSASPHLDTASCPDARSSDETVSSA